MREQYNSFSAQTPPECMHAVPLNLTSFNAPSAGGIFCNTEFQAKFLIETDLQEKEVVHI